MDDSTPIPTSVYRYYDRNGLTLYIGVTSRGERRNREHNGTQEWWPFVTRQEVEHYPSRAEALERERKLIRHYRPPFNTQYNAFHRELRELYVAATSDGRLTLPSPPAKKVLGQVQHRLPLSLVARGEDTLTLASDPAHAPLASVIQLRDRTALRAPKRVGSLVRVTPMGPVWAFEFALREGCPRITTAALHLRANTQPFEVWAHEAVAASRRVKVDQEGAA